MQLTKRDKARLFSENHIFYDEIRFQCFAALEFHQLAFAAAIDLRNASIADYRLMEADNSYPGNWDDTDRLQIIMNMHAYAYISHAANISKLFNGKESKGRLRALYDISDPWPLESRKVRDSIEHAYERIGNMADELFNWNENSENSKTKLYGSPITSTAFVDGELEIKSYEYSLSAEETKKMREEIKRLSLITRKHLFEKILNLPEEPND